MILERHFSHSLLRQLINKALMLYRVCQVFRQGPSSSPAHLGRED